MITFGYQGKPLFIQGPQDDAKRIIKTLKQDWRAAVTALTHGPDGQLRRRSWE